jgi:general secretion pathway protein A
MYHQHFGLSGPPFQFTPSPEALYLSRTHRECLAALEWGLLHDPTGYSLLVGQSGLGKTTLICAVLARGYNNVQAAFVTNPKLNFDQIMQVAMSQLAPTAAGHSKLDLVQGFTRLLSSRKHAERIAIIIDEAQELSDETLEELRLLSNVDTGRERRFQLILVGQTEMLERLASPRLSSLNQRIGSRVALKPLNRAEAHEYVECRLRAKGGSARKIFADGALDYLVHHSRGIPRKINVLCHNAMLLGYAASRKKVTLAMARSAVGEYEELLGVRHAPSRGDDAERLWMKARRLLAPLMAVGATAAALLAGLALYAWTSQTQLPDVWHSDSGTAAIRPQAGPVKTGPGILLGRVAASATQARAAAAAMLPGSNERSQQPNRSPDPALASGATPDNRTRSIRVQNGDTLAKIAARYMGSPDALDALLDANPQLRDRDTDRIYPGETLHLPPASAAANR